MLCAPPVLRALHVKAKGSGSGVPTVLGSDSNFAHKACNLEKLLISKPPFTPL